MAKTAKSQWEFGELFPAEALRKVLTVSELTGSIRRTLEKEIGTVCVMGEITNLSSGRLVYSTDSVGTINIEWEDIAKLSSPFFYRIEDHHGAVYYGSLAAPEAAGALHLVQSDGTSALLAMASLALFKVR